MMFKNLSALDVRDLSACEHCFADRVHDLIQQTYLECRPTPTDAILISPKQRDALLEKFPEVYEQRDELTLWGFPVLVWREGR